MNMAAKIGYWPEFINTKEKWEKVVRSIDSAVQFDKVAIKILDDDNIDILQFQQIVHELAKDVQAMNPVMGHIFTDLIHVVDNLIQYLQMEAKMRMSRLDEMFPVDKKPEYIPPEEDIIDIKPVTSFTPPPMYPGYDSKWVPKYIEYTKKSDRLSSFNTWPKQMNPKPEELAQAGFFYEGVSDYCRCFYCGLSVGEWEVDDKPIKEHAKWQPSCPYWKFLM